MKILLLGASGFIGSHVKSVLSQKHDVLGGTPKPKSKRDLKVDLLDQKTIMAALEAQPEVIINCAGVVENTARAKLNVEFTSNLLQAVDESGLKVRRIIISGSAAEYGPVADDKQAVPENAPLNANSVYGLSKLEESQLALRFRAEKNLPITIARIFNPIGIGMHRRLIIPG